MKSISGFRSVRRSFTKSSEKMELSNSPVRRDLSSGPGSQPDSRSVFPSIAKGRFFKQDRKSTRLNSSHVAISYAVFCLKKKKWTKRTRRDQGGCLSANQGRDARHIALRADADARPTHRTARRLLLQQPAQVLHTVGPLS